MASGLAERESQWDTLDRLAGLARAGKGQVALISGPVATGKTTLLQLFGEHLETSGFTWRRAIGAESEEALPYGVTTQLLGPVDPDHGLPELCRAALGSDEPVLITVDDVQHADEPSLEVLLACVRRLAGARALIVLTDNAAPGPLHTELLRHRHSTRLAVAPLSETAVGDPEAFALTGGNPLLLAALGEDAGEPGPNYRQALLSCVHRCGPEQARIAAVLGDSPGETPLLTAAGLLADGRFRHPAARAAVLAEMTPGERTGLFAWAARLRHEQGADPVVVAELLTGADRADEPWAGAVLVEAAEQAVQRERIEDAVRYLELARTTAEGAARSAIVARLARIEWRIRPAAANRHLAELITADLDDRDSISLVRLLLWYGRSDEAVPVLERVRASGPAGLHALELWLAANHPRLARPGTPPHAGDDTPGAVAADRSTAAILAVLGRSAAEPAVAEAELMLQVARPSDSLVWGAEAALQALLALLYADRLDQARSWCDKLLAEPGSVPEQAYLTAVRGEMALRRGELAAAWDDATAALELVPPAGWGVAAGLPLACAIVAATRMGRIDDAARLLAEPVPDAMLQSRWGVHYLHARGEHYLATGRDYAALADFLSCGKLTAEWGMDVPGLVPWRTSAADAWLRKSENRAEVRRLLNEQLARVGPGPSRTRGAALRLLAATSQAHSRPQLLAEAVSILRDCGDRFELARALADLSRAYRGVGQLRRASPMARLAAGIVEECGAAILHDEVLPLRTGHDAAGEPDTRQRLATLTESEMRVAVQAAAGLTNREIAAKLHITASTVEQHLTRVYRKLHVTRRRDLPPELHSHLPLAA
ncbi:LuxR C-terminal-related transcriptional regulator [Actinoplanes bogorensis]|uniref:LuxR C-terminal-related transcriptional regulator n=1 Tax=Paractinoplanes bogorensis TaxID=1610840 RepID=A0ABS5YLC4_9ACTN|nr:LuxR family transcriptional regulator [Actinoplanes bogorensis]MBU2663846.1 LuxR C-terminal-related transcriptional regulator [Actinoplanes bogorensis]